MKNMTNFEPGKVHAILFDIDGTLFSSEGIILKVYHEEMQHLQKETGKPEKLPSLDEIMAQIGKPVKKIFESLIPEVDADMRDALSDRILIHLVRRIESGEGEHYENAAQTLHTLADRGYKLCAASNGRRPYIEAILDAAGVINRFDLIPCIDNNVIHNKNELVAHTLQLLDLEPDQCALVGDRTSDRDAAMSAGIPFIAALYGHGHTSEHEGAVATIERMEDLLDLFPGFR